MHRADPEPRALELDRAPPSARRRGEHRAIVREQRCAEPMGRSGSVEARDDIGRLEDHERIRGDHQPGVVVEDVQDLDLSSVGKAHVGDVSLPAFVRHVGFEPHERAARSLLGLRGDEPPAHQDPPDRRDRGHLCLTVATGQVDPDRVRPCIEPEVTQLLAQLDDLVFECLSGAKGTSPRSARARLEPAIPFGIEAPADLVDPPG